MDGRMDDEASSINFMRRGLYWPSVVVDEDQVARLHLSKMSRVRVDPEPLGIDWVSKTNMS